MAIQIRSLKTTERINLILTKCTRFGKYISSGAARRQLFQHLATGIRSVEQDVQTYDDSPKDQETIFQACVEYLERGVETYYYSPNPLIRYVNGLPRHPVRLSSLCSYLCLMQLYFVLWCSFCVGEKDEVT